MATTALHVDCTVRFLSTKLNQWVIDSIDYVSATTNKFLIGEWLHRDDDIHRYAIIGAQVECTTYNTVEEIHHFSVMRKISLNPVLWHCSQHEQNYFISIHSNHLYLLDIELMQLQYFVSVPFILPSGLLSTTPQHATVEVNSMQLDADRDLLYLSVTQTQLPGRSRDWHSKQRLKNRERYQLYLKRRLRNLDRPTPSPRRSHALLCLDLHSKQFHALKTVATTRNKLQPNTYVVVDGIVHTLTKSVGATYCYVYAASLRSVFRFVVDSDSDGYVYECSVGHEMDEYVWKRLDVKIPACVDCQWYSVLLIYEHIALLMFKPRNRSSSCKRYGHIGASICFVDLKYKQMYWTSPYLPSWVECGHWALDEASGMVHGFGKREQCKFALKEIVPDELKMFYRHKICDVLITGYMKEKEQTYKVNIPLDVKRIVWSFYPVPFDAA